MAQGNGAASSRGSEHAAPAHPAMRSAVARIVRRAARTGRGPPIVRELIAAATRRFPADQERRREEVVGRLCALLERLDGGPAHSDGVRWLRETLRRGATRKGRPPREEP